MAEILRCTSISAALKKGWAYFSSQVVAVYILGSKLVSLTDKDLSLLLLLMVNA